MKLEGLIGERQTKTFKGRCHETKTKYAWVKSTRTKLYRYLHTQPLLSALCKKTNKFWTSRTMAANIQEEDILHFSIIRFSPLSTLLLWILPVPTKQCPS